MRKILTQEELDKKKKRTQILVGFVLIGTMLISTLAYAFFNQGGDSGNNTLKYKGTTFTKNNNGFWQFTIQNANFITSYNPSETESQNATSTFTLNEVYNNPLYLIESNPNAANEFIQNIGRYSSRYQTVCLDYNGRKLGDCSSENPVKTCSDNVLVFKEANQTNVYRDKNCLFIEASYSEQLIIIDKIIYKTIGIQ